MARKKKQEALTPRQRQSQHIMRQKKARKLRQAWLKRAALAGAAVFALAVVGGGVWVWKTGVIGQTAQATVDGAYKLTARAGFKLSTIYLEGRSRTPMGDIEQALGMKRGDPILRFSLEEIRQRLEQVESVKLAAVERELPGTLYVRIAEREPVALWQHEGRVALVDDNGAVMQGVDRAGYKHLPLIVGEGAGKHVAEMLAILASNPNLAKRFSAAVRVGDRRWNVRLTNGVEIKLPEADPLKAWLALADLQAGERLLDRDVKTIDLRVAGRLFITPAKENPKADNARET